MHYEGNVIFRADAKGPSPLTAGKGPYIKNRYVLWMLNSGDREAADSELIWLAALSQEAGLPAHQPVPTLDGRL